MSVQHRVQSDYNTNMSSEDSVEALCEMGQTQLMAMEYLESEDTLARAERMAWAQRDWDLLSRLHMPLQEARRQRRQRCGEGVVCLDLIAEGPNDRVDGRHVLEHYPHGQLLVAGWGSIEPGLKVRSMAAERGLYAETFLGAVYPGESGKRVVVIVPLGEMRLPGANPGGRSVEELKAILPRGCVVMGDDELPRGARKGTYQTYGEVMAMWERLHGPFLAAADGDQDLVARVEAYRMTIRVDYACELAHQRLSDAARELGRGAVRQS
jgi:hypothetical protein